MFLGFSHFCGETQPGTSSNPRRLITSCRKPYAETVPRHVSSYTWRYTWCAPKCVWRYDYGHDAHKLNNNPYDYTYISKYNWNLHPWAGMSSLISVDGSTNWSTVDTCYSACNLSTRCLRTWHPIDQLAIRRWHHVTIVTFLVHFDQWRFPKMVALNHRCLGFSIGFSMTITIQDHPAIDPWGSSYRNHGNHQIYRDP